jgi:hypothetical protein
MKLCYQAVSHVSIVPMKASNITSVVVFFMSGEAVDGNGDLFYV